MARISHNEYLVPQIFKYGGKLEKDFINEYSIDGQKAKFFGNINGNTNVKFNRIAMIASRYNDIISDLDKLIVEESKKPIINEVTGKEQTNQTYNLAVAFKLITQTGIRIGNESSAEGFMSTYKTKGKEVLAKTYGLTTLLHEHIKFKGDIAYLDFTGKKHVENTFILNYKLSKLVKPIYDSDFETVFNIDEYTLTKFIKDETSPYFSSKDFRTFRANVYANKVAKRVDTPKIKKEYREAVKEVTEFVSEKLNNTPAVVKTSYIDPLLFWYYFGKPDDLPSKLDGKKKVEKKESGGVISEVSTLKKGGALKDNMKCNNPKKTPSHKTKSHIVKACENGKEKIIRFGQQGVSGSPKKDGESEEYKKRRLAFKARHAKNIARGKLSAVYWADREKW